MKLPHYLSYIPILVSILALGCKSKKDTENGFDISKALVLENEGWKTSEEILERIIAPVFPDKEFSVLDFGAVNDERKDSNQAFKKAIEACHAGGGGKVVVPSGNYLSNGPIHLLSNVEFHLEKDAKIVFGTNAENYTPLVKVRWEGTLCYNYSPLIYANNQTNIAITGEGILDGQTNGTWSIWKDNPNGNNQEKEKPVLRKAGNDVTPVHTRVFGNGFLDLDGDGKDDGFGDGKSHYLRPSFIQLFECENILIEGVHLRNSPFWNVHPVFSKNITIRNINVQRGTTNDDGIDIDSCTDVLIEGCTIDTEDDAIAIKAGRDQDAWERPGSENIIIRNCNLKARWNGFCIGSEMSGDVRNVFFSNSTIRDGFHGINFKCNLDRGGQVEKVYIRDINIENCDEAMFIFRMDYHGYRGNDFPTKFNDFYASDINCNNVNLTGIKIVGVENQFIRRVMLNNITIKNAKTVSEIEFSEDIIANNVEINGLPWQLEANKAVN